MKPHRWEDAKRIFVEALEIPESARDAYLDSECADDAQLRTEVNRLIEASSSRGSAFQMPARKMVGVVAGQQIGDFVLERELGSGGTGVVFLATQTSLGRKVAVKLLRSDLHITKVQAERFRREATATAKLAHRGIVSIQAIGSENEVQYLAMDYIEGESLDRVLENQKADGVVPDPLEWAQVASEVADALHYAHREGVIHRDVKPHNIIIDADGYPHVLDFGLAKVESMSSLSRSGDIAGTLHYMSPEQALAKRVQLDHRSDIFSLGCVLYELLSNKRAFEGETMQEVLFGISFREPTPIRRLNPKVSVELETICTKAMEKNPEKRYASAGEFADDLRRYLADESISARPPSFVRRLRRQVRRRPRLTIGIGVLLGVAILTAVAVLAIAAYRTHRAKPRIEVVSDTPGDFVFVQPLDFLGTPKGLPQEVGETPVQEHRLASGYYRIVVERAGFGFSEFVRLLDRPGSITRISARLVDREVVNAQMVLIKGGVVRLGSGKPSHSGYFEREFELPSYLIDENEVTNRQFKAFCDATDHGAPEQWGDTYDPAWNELPVTGVSYYDARAYAEWVGKRLPTCWEWERAIIGVDSRAPFSVREHANVGQGRSSKSKFDAYLDAVRPARDEAFRQGPDRLFHMIGNVEEWTDSIVLAARLGGGHQAQVAYRVARSGAWFFRYEMSLRANGATPVLLEANTLGFRCAKSVRGPEGQ